MGYVYMVGGERTSRFFERDLNLHLEGSRGDLCDVTRDGIIGYAGSYSNTLELIGPLIYEKKGKRCGLSPNIGATGAKHHSPSYNSNHIDHPHATLADRHRKTSVIAPSTSVYLGMEGRDKNRKLMALEGD